MKFILILAILLPVTVMAVDCPVKEGEPNLTIMRVMYNFRDYLNDPDLTAKKGNADPGSVSDAELTAALSDLQVTLACAAKALEKTEAMYPERYFELEGEAREKYMTEFYDYLNQFNGLLKEYYEMFKGVSETPLENRSYKDLSIKALDVRDLANEAHHHL